MMNNFLIWFFNLSVADTLMFGFRFMFLLSLFLIATRTWRTVYRIHIRRPLKRWLNTSSTNKKVQKMKPQPRKTAVQLLNHYFAQALYFYNTKEAAENKYFCMYGDTFFGAKSMIKLLSNDEELNNHAEN